MTLMNRKMGGSKVSIKNALQFSAILFFIVILINAVVSTGCGVYRFADVSIPDSIKTVRINFFENRARYVNPQLSPQLTDKLRQKIVSQTRLTQVNNDNAHYDITGYISDYTVSTSGISNQTTQTNRLTVGVHVVVNNRLSNTTQDYDVSRSFEFAASSSLQAAEAQLMDEMVRNVSDDIFNRIFSNW